MRRRNIQIKFRVDETEYAKLQNDLKACGLTQSAFLRRLIMGSAIQERLPRDYYSLCTEVSRIGNNINQIARIANQYPEALPDLHKVQLLQARIYDLLSDP